MNNKGALEISVNAIVILIIALAVLGLIIGFAVNKFNEVSGEIGVTKETPEPTAQAPVQLPGGGNSLQLTKGVQNTFEIKVYNAGSTGVVSSLAFDCAPSIDAATTFEAPTSTISAGASGSIPVSATVAPAESVGKKSCTLTIGDTSATDSATVSKTVFLEIQ